MISEGRSLLRWQFARGAHHITCGIDVAPDNSGYDVLTVPHWDVNSAVIETFDAPGEALQRHATIASRLREIGWTVASHTY